MFSDLLHRVQEQFSQNLPCVVYRKPKQKKVTGIFQQSDDLHILSDWNKSGFVFAPFDNLDNVILIPVDELLEANDFGTKEYSLPDGDYLDDTQRLEHIDLVESGIAEIAKNSFEKVVLSRKIRAVAKADTLLLFQRILATYDSAFCYLWYHPKIGLWLGATPEILVRTENNNFTTMSLAGTQPHKEGENPSWGDKELKEQRLVTDYIKQALNEKVSGLQAADLETVKAGNVLHLRTKLSGRMVADIEDVIMALHPTPAVCGLPRTATKEFILAHENYDREYYTGFLGELNFKEEIRRSTNRKNQENSVYKSIKSRSELFVNLRCMKLENEIAYIYVGGGITSESNPEKEWQETVKKSETMLRILS